MKCQGSSEACFPKVWSLTERSSQGKPPFKVSHSLGSVFCKKSSELTLEPLNLRNCQTLENSKLYVFLPRNCTVPLIRCIPAWIYFILPSFIPRISHTTTHTCKIWVSIFQNNWKIFLEFFLIDRSMMTPQQYRDDAAAEKTQKMVRQRSKNDSKRSINHPKRSENCTFSGGPLLLTVLKFSDWYGIWYFNVALECTN